MENSREGGLLNSYFFGPGLPIFHFYWQDSCETDKEWVDSGEGEIVGRGRRTRDTASAGLCSHSAMDVRGHLSGDLTNSRGNYCWGFVRVITANDIPRLDERFREEIYVHTVMLAMCHMPWPF